jgi:hypothetical protein
MLRVVRDLAVAVVGGASVGLVVAYSGHSTTLALWAALGGSIFVLATCFVIEHRRAVDTRPRPGLSTRPTATERVAHDILVDEFGRPSLPELRRALKAERRKGRELLASIRYSLKHPYGGKMDMELQDDFMKWAGGWPIYLSEYAPALYNVFRERGLGQGRNRAILTIYDLKTETKHSLKMLRKVRRHLWWETALRWLPWR